MENNSAQTEKQTAGTAQPEKPETSADNQSSGSKLPLIILVVLLLLAGLIYLFVRLSSETTGKIRDVSVILFVLESIITVTAITVLVIQLAKLVNFLKYELSPILNTTDRTVKKLSGTVSFLCDSAVEPTVKAASTISGIRNAADGVLSIFKKK